MSHEKERGRASNRRALASNRLRAAHSCGYEGIVAGLALLAVLALLALGFTIDGTW